LMPSADQLSACTMCLRSLMEFQHHPGEGDASNTA